MGESSVRQPAEPDVEPAFLDADALRAAQSAIGRLAPDPWRPDQAELRIGGCFVAFARGEQGPGRSGDHAWAGAAVVGERGSVRSTAVVAGVAGAPYEPGLLALREGQLLLDGLRTLLRSVPARGADVVLVDATGRDHPRGCGLAVHLGYLLDLPTVGVTHRLLTARDTRPPVLAERGQTAGISIDGRLCAAWCCTSTGARPVVVHAAWRTDVPTAVDVVLRCTRTVRTPEPLRVARRLAREAREELR